MIVEARSQRGSPGSPAAVARSLGLSASILIDASVIRLLIVPATMFLLGRYNWWTPAGWTASCPTWIPKAGWFP